MELEATAASPNINNAALVIGFDDGSWYVAATDESPLETLNQHVRNGGQPLGMIVNEHVPGTTEVHVRAWPLAEFEGEEWVEKYLLTLLAAFRDAYRANGGDVGPVTA